MARVSRGKYNLQVAAIMAVYVALMLFEWPLVGKTHDLTVRAVLALLPAAPIVVVIALVVRRIIRADELEQRTYLIALSMAAGIVSVFAVVGGFLILAKVWHASGAVLFWIFPMLCFAYSIAWLFATRRITGVWDFWGC